MESLHSFHDCSFDIVNSLKTLLSLSGIKQAHVWRIIQLKEERMLIECLMRIHLFSGSLSTTFTAQKISEIVQELLFKKSGNDLSGQFSFFSIPLNTISWPFLAKEKMPVIQICHFFQKSSHFHTLPFTNYVKPNGWDRFRSLRLYPESLWSWSRWGIIEFDPIWRSTCVIAHEKKRQFDWRLFFHLNKVTLKNHLLV